MLSKSTHTLILTSASLCNEEYELINDLACTLKRAHTMHIPFDEAERLREGQLYRDFLLLTGQLRVSSGNEVEGAAAEYFQSQSAVQAFLSRARLKPAQLSLFATSLQEGRTIFITDGDRTATDALEAFTMHAHIQRDRAKLLIMQRGLNPAGARAWSERHKDPQELNRQLLEEYDTLLIYRLPKLFPLKKQQVIHFAYAPLTDYGRGGIFFPSSSLLETGGTISLYDGEETSLKPVLKNEANLDNARILRGIIQHLM